MFVCFGALNVLGIPPLLPIDERAHLGYALSIAEGELPTVDTPLPSTVFPASDRDYRNDIWVANHPPLYYAIVAPLASGGLAIGGIEAAVGLVRWLSLLLGAAALVFVHATAKLVTNGDRDVALLATLAAALMPHTLHICSLVHNDSLAILLATATLYSGVLVAVRGYSHARASALAVTTALAMLTRFTSIAVVVPACGIACVGLLLRSEQPVRQRIKQSASTAGIAAAAILITSGWFYLRNFQLYGDVTGGAALFEKVGRTARGGALGHALKPRLWRQIYQDLWTRFSGGTRIDGLVWDLAWL
ncbi:MAG TPA: glycosyltransferase family 39 protein, partial [Enhygromyxa sp.]|nr:glycosyltransferase family 39 protein [Enhygromyxa sp.]